MLFSNTEKELIASGECTEDDFPSSGGLSDAYVQEKVEECVEFLKNERNTVPLHIQLFNDVADVADVMEFLQVDTNVMMRLKVHDALVLASALQRFIDQNKYMIADSEMNDFQMEEAYVRGLIIDILIAEHWYMTVLKLISDVQENDGE